tara:strand:+ start:53231 stop:53938 length:708 start_codon:yes stop_codon:yes gene_type:complete
MTSTRLPGKVLRPIVGKASLHHQIARIQRAADLDGVIVATTVNASDDPIVRLADDLGIPCFRGDEHDVLGRFQNAIAATDAKVVVRLTGDCPLTDPSIIDHIIRARSDSNADYASNTLERSYPIGMDVEAFTREALEQADRSAETNDEREHVTPYIYRNPELFTLHNVVAPDSARLPDLRLTLDTEEDLRLITAVFEALYPENPLFSLGDILAFLVQNPDLRNINRDVAHKWLDT